MELFGPTLVLYLVIGIGVAGALFLAESGGQCSERCFRLLSAIFFWPLFLPILLARPKTTTEADLRGQMSPQDDLAVAIDQVDAELLTALGSLDGWAEDVLAREKDRFQELRAAWNVQADRIREMDRVLAMPEYAGPEADMEEHRPCAATATHPENGGDRLWTSRIARQKNIERLRHVRRRAYDDLLATLAWVRELVSMIHLAKFTGAPAARAEELVAQIAAAVEGLSAVTWQEEAGTAVAG